MADDWLELHSGGVPVSIWFCHVLQDLRKIAEGAHSTPGINRHLELCLIGLVSYFEAFCKDLFSFTLNLYPDLLERLRDWDGHDTTIDPLLAVKMGEKFRDKVGFILAERFDFGTAKEVNASFVRLLKITPFSKDEMQSFSDLLRDRNLVVHHGGTFTYRYLDQIKANQEDAHWNSLVVDKAIYLRHHEFIEKIARKMLAAAHRALTEFGESAYGTKGNAPVEFLLHWDESEPDGV